MRKFLLILMVFSIPAFAVERNDCSKETDIESQKCHDTTDKAINDSNAEGFATKAATASDEELQNTGSVQVPGLTRAKGRYDDGIKTCKESRDRAEQACQKAWSESQAREEKAHTAAEKAQERDTRAQIDKNWTKARKSIKEDNDKLFTGSYQAATAIPGSVDVDKSR
jgi:hypothetical protein